MNKSGQKQINGVLKEYRDEINRLDEEIVRLIGERFKIIKKLSKIKEKNDIPVFISDRIREVVGRAEVLAKKYGVEPKLVYGIYNSMIIHTCLLEDEVINRKNKVKK